MRCGQHTTAADCDTRQTSEWIAQTPPHLVAKIESALATRVCDKNCCCKPADSRAMHDCCCQTAHTLSQVTWRPFQLNPQLPQDDEGRNKLNYYKEKFGAARTEQMLPQMTVCCAWPTTCQIQFLPGSHAIEWDACCWIALQKSCCWPSCREWLALSLSAEDLQE